ncbi:MAG: hypothetical protein ABWY36_05420 [Leifsonia sp.]
MTAYGNAVSPYDEELVVSLVAKKVPFREVAAQIGCTPRTISRILRRQKVPPLQTNTPYTEEELAFAEALLRDGCPYTEVARTLGRDDEHLARLFPGYGAGSPAESLAIARMFRDFERLLERLGLSDVSSTIR